MNTQRMITRLETWSYQLDLLHKNEVFAYARHAITKRRDRVESALFRLRTRENARDAKRGTDLSDYVF